MHLHFVQIRIRVRLGRLRGDVQLVVDIRVEVEARLDHGVHRLARGRQRDRDVPQEVPAEWIGDERALVADDRVVEARRPQERQHRLEHPAGDDDHVRPGRADALDRSARARPQHEVGADQGAVEVDRERGDVAREARRQLDYGVPPVDFTTYAATSAICCAVSLPPNDGMTPLPSVTRAVALR